MVVVGEMVKMMVWFQAFDKNYNLTLVPTLAKLLSTGVTVVRKNEKKGGSLDFGSTIDSCHYHHYGEKVYAAISNCDGRIVSENMKGVVLESLQLSIFRKEQWLTTARLLWFIHSRTIMLTALRETLRTEPMWSTREKLSRVPSRMTSVVLTMLSLKSLLWKMKVPSLRTSLWQANVSLKNQISS